MVQRFRCLIGGGVSAWVGTASKVSSFFGVGAGMRSGGGEGEGESGTKGSTGSGFGPESRLETVEMDDWVCEGSTVDSLV